MIPSLLVLLAVLLLALPAAAQYPDPGTNPLWPLPSSYSLGNKKVYLSKTFKFNAVLSSYIVNRGFKRYQDLIGASRAVPSDPSAVAINSCDFTFDSTLDQLTIDTDETYTLSISETGVCTAHAKTVYGVLRALETFSQVLSREGDSVVSNLAPVTVTDKPRFAHRGLLVDTARHYLPVSTLKSIIDTLPINKFNVLHWHTVDAESFPLVTPSAPTLSQAAFSPQMIYTAEDMNDLTNYAKDRGVVLLMEVDVPGHAASWNVGKPEIMANCFAKYSYNINDFALNPTLDETFSTIKSILSDIVSATRTSYIHLGGDEVVYGCWGNDTQIVNYMNANHLNYDQLLGQFVQKVDDIASKLFLTPIHWEEVFQAGAPVAPGTIFQVWTNASNVAAITSAQHKVIVSTSSYWYLDHAANTWKVMYAYDPTVNLTSSQAEYVIGGETAMWGEYIDADNIIQTVYPRASAVSERLWSPSTVVDQTDANQRLVAQRCRMANRGIRGAPVQPGGYCPIQYV